MTHRERLAAAWSFREPDRVPIEIHLSTQIEQYPSAARLVEAVREHADNFLHAPGADHGFFGLSARVTDEPIEDVPGSFKRVRHVQETEAGPFTAITLHPEGVLDYHWEKRYISTLNDLRRLAEAPRAQLGWDKAGWQQAVADIGERGFPLIFLPHPLGRLVRNADMEAVYAWFHEAPQLLHCFLEAANRQMADVVAGMLQEGMGPAFVTYAHEMLIPPWLGRPLFDEFVFPYDKLVNDAIHRHGGKLRIHCHGPCMDYLDLFSTMGVDAIEPLEHAPMGNVDLAEAKKRVGRRMLLSGNVASERFVSAAPDEVRREVRDAIAAAAAGGGFTLATSSATVGADSLLPEETLKRVVANCEAYLSAALEFGRTF